ncbi:MAG: hypothetical protein IK102_00735 [Treponema sp.]|nr:hypothetical protein [Treponema sp.]
MKKEKKDKLKNAGAFFLTLSDRTPAASGLTQVWEVIKKIGVWIFTVLAAIFAVLFIREKDCRVTPDNDTTEEDINAKAAKKRKEAIERISNADARSICESYGTVCDTIADGKSRFRKRCGRADN